MLDELWYKNAVIYSLDYLHALGLDTIRLAPFQPTPNRDNDISDFYGVDSRHGSSGDQPDYGFLAYGYPWFRTG